MNIIKLAKRITTVFAVIAVAGLAAGTLYHFRAIERNTLKENFQQELNMLHKQYRFPGATAAYILPDGTVEAFAVGMADLELKVPMAPDSRMLAASTGKTFVAAEVLALAQEGVLDLDDPLSEWLGGHDWFSRLPNGNAVSLRQLLTHSSGIPDHVTTESFKKLFRENRNRGGAPLSPEELISCVLDLPALFRPGKGWNYSDTGYILLGMVVEKAAGKDYYEETGLRFIRPLRLTLTSASDRRALPGLAAGYLSKKNTLGLPAKTTLRPGLMAWHPGVEWTGGGLVSNPKDLVVWAKALYEGNAINGPYLPALLESVPVSKDDPGTRYGMGVAVHERGPMGKSYGHSGWIPGYCSCMRYYPGSKTAVAFQINTDIGIINGSTRVFQDMEERLAKVIMDSLDNTGSLKKQHNAYRKNSIN